MSYTPPQNENLPFASISFLPSHFAPSQIPLLQFILVLGPLDCLPLLANKWLWVKTFVPTVKSAAEFVDDHFSSVYNCHHFKVLSICSILTDAHPQTCPKQTSSRSLQLETPTDVGSGEAGLHPLPVSVKEVGAYALLVKWRDENLMLALLSLSFC